MDEATCIGDGCEKPAVTRNLCHGHYSRLRRYGDANAPRRPAGAPRRTSDTCGIDGCDGAAGVPGTARGWCRHHYHRFQKYGDPLAPIRQAAPYGDTPCLVVGCDGPVLARGWCCAHYNRWHQHGHPEALADSEQARRAARAREGETGQRFCRDCATYKPLDEFCRDATRPDGLRAHCRPCTAAKQYDRWARDPEKWRAYHRARYAANPEPARAYSRARYAENPEYFRERSLITNYGLTLADWNRMWAEQGQRCLLCEETPDKQPVVDHCHRTGRVRGLLCQRCNLTLGFVESRGVDRIAWYLAEPDEEGRDVRWSRQGEQQGEEHPVEGHAG